jgi:Na+-transporting NADH:ubiquinone oxidoreductase subunit C
MERSTNYILVFATAVCLVCSIFVSAAAVALKDRQDLNKKIDMQKKVLLVAGVLGGDDGVADTEIPGLFEKSIEARVVNLKSGEISKTDPATYDQLKASKDPATSIAVGSAAATAAGVARIPNEAFVYVSKKDQRLIFPIEGKGLWSTLYGFLALNSDLNTVEGIIFYQHGETPGFGGEIENPRWTGLWPGKKLFDGKGTTAI